MKKITYLLLVLLGLTVAQTAISDVVKITPLGSHDGEFCCSGENVGSTSLVFLSHFFEFNYEHFVLFSLIF